MRRPQSLQHRKRSVPGRNLQPAAVPVPMPPPVPNANIRTLFHIKFVQQDTAYIDGGRTAGLTEGMKLLLPVPVPTAQLPKGISPMQPLRNWSS